MPEATIAMPCPNWWAVKKFFKTFFSFWACLLFYTDDKKDGRNTVTPLIDATCSSSINHQAERLLSAYGNNVLRLAYSYLKNMSDAEDALQDTLIQFMKTKPQFESAAHEKAWLLRVAINVSKNKLSYRNIRKTDELSDTLATNEKEDLSFVWESVKALPPKYREVVHLFYHEGYATGEIASILSKNEATVRSLLLRARAKLKDALKEGYDFEE